MANKDQTTDTQLIERILNGERQCYKELVERHSSMVFHLARRFSNNEETVKDLVQQVFVKVYERLESFRGDASFSSWLYRLSMNHFRDYAKNIRRKNQRFSEMEEYEVDARLGHEDTPDQNLERDQESARLFQALDELPEKYAEPLLLKYRDGMSYKVISDRLDVSVSALKVRVHRARKELKQIMKRYE
jgi:RNA polymerase sigma-70 factor (ECF subfamily)